MGLTGGTGGVQMSGFSVKTAKTTGYWSIRYCYLGAALWYPRNTVLRVLAVWKYL